MDKQNKLDGSGQPFITLAQFLKRERIVDTGGMAKHFVREGGIKVNGEDESRPGRKLHAGDKVEAGGKKLVVTL